MPSQDSTRFFDQQCASNYDQNYARLALLRDALQLLIQILFSELPVESRVLCVGVGTGSELIALAQQYPHWQFTAVEPSAPMMDICRQRIQQAGIESRCTFHQGYIHSLPETPPFDAATCLLVSHFIMDRTERGDFFQNIASRLRPQGYLVNADLTADMSAPDYPDRLEKWLQLQGHAGLTEEKRQQMRSIFGRDVALLPPREMESLLIASGLQSPTLFYQAHFIHAWHSQHS